MRHEFGIAVLFRMEHASQTLRPQSWQEFRMHGMHIRNGKWCCCRSYALCSLNGAFC